MNLNKLTQAARIALGATFVFVGANYWLQLMPTPAFQGEAAAYLGALFTSGYLAIVKALEMIAGALLLTRRFAAIGLLILGPILLNILLFLTLLGKTFDPIATVSSGLALFLLWAWRERFAGLILPREEPIAPFREGTTPILS